MSNIITVLLMAQRAAQVHHWKTKSFARHLAFGELYELLAKMTDQLVEEAAGEIGTEFVAAINQSEPNQFAEADELEYIGQLHSSLAMFKNDLPNLAWLENTFEELQSQVARIKYKLENLV